MHKKTLVYKGIITFLVLLYLLLVILNKIPERLQINEILLFLIILLLNAGLFEKLTQIRIDKDGIELQMKEIEAEQKKQKASIDANQQILQTRVSTHLELINQKSQEENKIFLANMLEDSTWNLLTQLSLGEYLPYKKTYTFEVDLRKLRTLGLITNKPGMRISDIPNEGDLRDYLEMTSQGKQYLEVRKNILGTK
ncbi:MAG: hypothetical protein RLZZ338_352 [Cyanobacteriota bacterium]|jgi:hypothetical protein